MPIPRKKSCAACRTAKTRCSLTVPCQRCADRHLQCDYGSSGPRVGLDPVPTNLAVCRHGNSAAPMNRVVDSRLAAPIPVFDSQAGIPSVAPLAVPLVVADTQFDFLSGFMSHGCPPSDNPYFCSPACEDDLHGVSIAGANELLLPTVDRVTSNRLDGRVQNRLLAQRNTTTTETFLTAKVLLGQIKQYPRMMIEGNNLPPFIHPRCASGNWDRDSCASAGKHVCMPEILAVCANLIHLFYNRTPASSRFAWETIYKHQKQLYNEYRSYGSDQLLEALQATVIYLLLQAEDPDSIEVNDTMALIETILDVAKRYGTLNHFQSELGSPYSVGRKTWTEIESARRTVCLLWVIELVLDVMIGSPRENEMCGGYLNVPLPCDRQLWEPTVGDAEWTRRYRRSLGRRESPPTTPRIRDLGHPRQTPAPPGSTGSGSGGAGREGERLAEWCEGLDEFGALVWLAAMLERRSNGRG